LDGGGVVGGWRDGGRLALIERWAEGVSCGVRRGGGLAGEVAETL